MSNRFDLTGKNAIVTGATGGIGLAIVRGFAEAGANVTLCGRKQETVDAALAELGSVKDKVLGVVAHVGKSEDLETLLGRSGKEIRCRQCAGRQRGDRTRISARSWAPKTAHGTRRWTSI